jgi:hypothetical protein
MISITTMTSKLTKKPNLVLFTILLLALTVLFRSQAVSAAACPAPSTDRGSVTSTLSIPSTGTYRVWSRIMTGAASTDNSYSLEIDGANCYVVGDNTSMPASTWTWVDYQSGTTSSKIDVSLSAGNHTIKMIGIEDGVKVDRIIAAADTTCTPTGTGTNCDGTPVDSTPPAVSVTAPSTGSTVTGSSVTVSANASDDVAVAGVQFKLDGSNLGSLDAISPYSTSWNTTTATNGTHTLSAIATDTAGNATTSSSVTVTVNNPVGTATSIWPLNPTPVTLSDPDTVGTELGVKFKSDVSGQITGIRFYKSSTNTGTHIGSLWSSTGTKLTSATFTGETTSGWQQMLFTTPVNITAGTVYVASYYAPAGHYSSDSGYFTSKGQDSPPLHALQTGVSGPNGVYVYSGTASTFPNQTFGDANYWVDVVFSPTTSTGPKTGDINGDNAVNITDLSLLLSSYGQNTTQCITNNAFKCDLSSPGDGVINIFDLSILLSGYGS